MNNTNNKSRYYHSKKRTNGMPSNKISKLPKNRDRAQPHEKRNSQIERYQIFRMSQKNALVKNSPKNNRKNRQKNDDTDAEYRIQKKHINSKFLYFSPRIVNKLDDRLLSFKNLTTLLKRFLKHKNPLMQNARIPFNNIPIFMQPVVNNLLIVKKKRQGFFFSF